MRILLPFVSLHDGDEPCRGDIAAIVAGARVPAGFGRGSCTGVGSCESAGAQLSEQSDGAQAPREFLQHAVDLAHEYHFAIVQDFAYAGLGVDAQQISILSLPGAFDVAVEVCSLSKMYAMAAGVPVSSQATTTSCLM